MCASHTQQCACTRAAVETCTHAPRSTHVHTLGRCPRACAHTHGNKRAPWQDRQVSSQRPVLWRAVVRTETQDLRAACGEPLPVPVRCREEGWGLSNAHGRRPCLAKSPADPRPGCGQLRAPRRVGTAKSWTEEQVGGWQGPLRDGPSGHTFSRYGHQPAKPRGGDSVRAQPGRAVAPVWDKGLLA